MIVFRRGGHGADCIGLAAPGCRSVLNLEVLDQPTERRAGQSVAVVAQISAPITRTRNRSRVRADPRNFA